jgi:outer membrane protein insertion porin family
LRTHRGSVLRGSSVDYDKTLIKNHYKDRGYLDISVAHEIESKIGTDNVFVIYSLESNDGKTYVSDIHFNGSDSIKRSKLKKEIKSKESGFFSKNILNIKTINEDVSRLTKFYRENGFLDVKVSYEITNDENKYKKLNFNIVENNQSIIKSVNFIGQEIYEIESLEDIFSYKNDTPYSEKKIRIGLQKIRESYGSIGHALANTISDYNPETEVLTIMISEGEKYQIESIVVSGNYNMKEEIVLRDITFEIDQRVNTEEITNSLNQMRQTGYYDDVKIDFEPTQNGLGTIYIQVKEASTQMIEFGVGYASSGLGGDIGFRNQNLFNAGKAISFKASKSKELLKLGMVYQDPHLFGSDLEMDVSLNGDHGEQGHYDRTRASLSVMISKKITENLKLGLGTRVEFLDINEVSNQLANEVYDATGTKRTIGMMSTLVYKSEKYDSVGDAISGKRMKIALLPSYSEEGLYAKVVSEVIGHRSLGQNSSGSHHILSGRVTLGYTSDNTPYYEKFYAGGTGTIRGYKNNSISSDGSATGGNYSLSASGSYSFPIWKDFLKGVAFVEAASVSEEFEELGDVRVVAGLGVRANLKQTFLRNNIEAGFAMPLSNRSRDEDILRPFYFMLGSYDPAYDL